MFDSSQPSQARHVLRNGLSALALTLALATQAQAAPAFGIPGLYNTGVDDSGLVLSEDAPDSHYTLTAGPALGATYAATAAGGYPVGSWLGDDGLSAWIAPTLDTFYDHYGPYTYSTQFDLTGFNAASAAISGRWASDDELLDIVLNGHSLDLVGGTYTAWTEFAIPAGSAFVAGLNTLNFVVANSGFGPTGLRVEMDGTAAPVPVPGAFLLFGSALLPLFGYRRGKSKA